MKLPEKTAFMKNPSFLYRPKMSFFWKPIPNLVVWQFFRIFGQVLFDCEWLGSYRHFFQYPPFSLEIVPISQISSKSNNPNTHFGEFFKLYTNQITKKLCFQLNPTLSHRLGWGTKTQIFFFPRHPDVIFYSLIFCNVFSFWNKINLGRHFFRNYFRLTCKTGILAYLRIY